MSNYFDLEDPDDWLCSIEKMGRFNPALNVRMENPSNGQIVRVFFLLPTYIRCPMQWQGGNFRLASLNERQEFSAIFQIDLNRLNYLFVCNHKNSVEQIQILAMNGQIRE